MKITGCTILTTRNWFAENSKECIDDAIGGIFRVNNLDEYISWQSKNIIHYLTGQSDNTFTFKQRAWFLQTGKCFPLLNI